MAGGTRSCSISRLPRIAEALARRAQLATRSDLNAYRLVHGEADGIPGLAVDRYADTLIVHADSSRVAQAWEPVLRAEFEPRFARAFQKLHPTQASRLTARERAVHAPREPMWGTDVATIEALENGVRYEIRPADGLSVGLFLDMREVRTWLRANSANRRVLNLFAYTCSFGVCATLAGAARVLNLDLSRRYLEWGQANYRLNGLPVDGRDFVYGDAFDWLARFARRGEMWDIVILDPPSFSSTRSGAFSVERDYVRLASLAARTVAPGGMLIAATNHAGTYDERFDAWLAEALAAAQRHAGPPQRWHEPLPDFPVPPGRAPYLKVRALALE